MWFLIQKNSNGRIKYIKKRASVEHQVKKWPWIDQFSNSIFEFLVCCYLQNTSKILIKQYLKSNNRKIFRTWLNPWENETKTWLKPILFSRCWPVSTDSTDKTKWINFWLFQQSLYCKQRTYAILMRCKITM